MLEQMSSSVLVTWSAPLPEGEATTVEKYVLTYFPSDGEEIEIIFETNYLFDDLLSNTAYTVQVFAIGYNDKEGPNAENYAVTRK